MKALVYKSTGSWYIVKNDSGESFNARIKGVMKIEGITSTNPIAVGDYVTAEMEDQEDVVTINNIQDRKNYITRTSPHNKNQHHIVAANLDQCMLFATLKDPKTSQGFIDRFLVTAEAYHIPAIVIFNKEDLYKKKELDKLAEVRDMYEAIGYGVLSMSIEKNTGLENVTDLLKNKITLLSGHSGVGKSSFINKLFPELQLRIQDVSGWSGKGLHTTTFAEMFDLPFGGKIIDTPGIRELGLVDISRQELSHFYPEMRQILNECQFNDCQHVNEPGCAVKQAVEDRKIHIERYLSYRNMLDTIDTKNY
ncbi:MAG TPA: ribosome small subunit-dependent GTPase A [Chitinophagaceae bacterium]|jgi:ribosome biogenesis GTPase|nr:ribosome small subunit-dependent GTPase A [Chitinophagaceae bacterium]